MTNAVPPNSLRALLQKKTANEELLAPIRARFKLWEAEYAQNSNGVIYAIRAMFNSELADRPPLSEGKTVDASKWAGDLAIVGECIRNNNYADLFEALVKLGGCNEFGFALLLEAGRTDLAGIQKLLSEVQSQKTLLEGFTWQHIWNSLPPQLQYRLDDDRCRLFPELWRRNGMGPQYGNNSTPAEVVPVAVVQGDAEAPAGVNEVAKPVGKTPVGVPKPSSKGKNIDARMLDVVSKNHESHGWSKRKWAERLDCSSSTIGDTNTWKVILPDMRAYSKADSTANRNKPAKGSRRPQRKSQD